MFEKGKDRGKRAKTGARAQQQFDEQGFDASPDDKASQAEPASRFPTQPAGAPKNIQETRLYKESVGGARQVWFNYVNMLVVSFRKMNRRGQEELIIKVSQIVTVGTAIITMSAWYWFLPQTIRVLLLPAVLIGSWFIGTRVVGPSMINRFSRHLNPDDF